MQFYMIGEDDATDLPLMIFMPMMMMTTTRTIMMMMTFETLSGKLVPVSPVLQVPWNALGQVSSYLHHHHQHHHHQDHHHHHHHHHQDHQDHHHYHYYI